MEIDSLTGASEEKGMESHNIAKLDEKEESVVLERYEREANRIFRYFSKPGHHLQTDKVMDTMDMVWISVCYPIEYEQIVEGAWKWMYSRNDKGKTISILVAKIIFYIELYDKVKEALNIDTSLYKMDISSLVSIMSKAPTASIIIDYDNNVK
ncbi:uncharacterized protein LOC111402440 [Olea europaea var. sylvestris]|uniref:uncharacterized protein LOC111402440 n=1 Tax=Olea europaea var. sylvestris TaxID=158386 RepID=UPI000C1D48FD|nr:uncharacterized protein LOC111402440 [Olea europaea var. sylvestris]XP_022886504.1 uncharacterized protein LOC111402440 [Olea europaea var. sylvestris]